MKERREELGLSQDDLAARLQSAGLNVSRASISHWEMGRYDAPLHDADFRRALATALRLKPRVMLLMAGYEVEDDPHSEAAERAAYIIDQLPPEKQRLALGILEQFLAQSS
jgi:transcriptional regulator with XRE-family HTH domain